MGKRTAERFVFYMLNSGKKDVGELTIALKELMDKVKSCEICWDFSDKNPCPICTNEKRERSIICVVAQPQDLQVFEGTRAYHGQYHVLRGLIRADSDKSVSKTKIRELFERVGKEKPKEIILALNSNLEGETTSMYIAQKLKDLHPECTITRLARGLPMGSDLQYADDITLMSALKNRQKQ